MSAADLCPIVGLTTFGKLMYELSFTFGIYCSWLFIFGAVYIIMQCRQHSLSPTTPSRLTRLYHTLVKGLVRIIKFTYAKLCGIVFMSVTCIGYARNYVWWYDATNVCLETWQIVMATLGVLYVIPFPLALFIAMNQLNNRHIDATLFIIFCVCPGPAVCYTLVRTICKCHLNAPQKHIETDTGKSLQSVLHGPYRGGGY